jgi:hypothetical protein
MKKSVRTKSAWTSAVSLVILFSCFEIIHNWSFHARLSLLINGYVLCQLRAPASVEDLELTRDNQMVSKVVFCRGHYVGALDPFGEFTPSGAHEPSEDRLRFAVTVIECLMVVCAVAFMLGCFSLITGYTIRDRMKGS